MKSLNKKQSKASRQLIRDCLRGQKFRIFLNCVFSAVMSLTYIILALVSKAILDVATGDREGNFTVYILALCGVVVFQLVLHALSSHLSITITGKMGIYLRNRLFVTLKKKKYSSVYPYHSGELLNRFISDADIVVQSSSGLVPQIVGTVTKLLSGATALLLLDWRFAGGLIALGIIVPFLARLIGEKYKYLHKEHQQAGGLMKSFLQEMFRNLPIVKTFVSQRPVENKLNVLMKRQYTISIKRNYISIATSVGFYLLFTAGYFLAIIWGATGIMASTVTYGSLMAFLQILSQLRAPMQNLSGFMPRYYSMTASADRLCELCELEDELSPVNENVLSAVRDVFSTIRCEAVGFSYENEEVLKSCSFMVNRGEITVISGESGGGKSTLFRLMLGYFDADKGHLSFDGKYEINASTRGLFAYVPQGNMILSGTLKENITLCTADASDDQIHEAIHTAVLDEWLDTLPDGINTKIGENGLGISEGQAQRIAVARALLCKTPVLLLDEATSALDHETEEKLLRNIKQLNDKTVFLVTHRTFGTEICDRHLHLQNGTMTEVKE